MDPRRRHHDGVAPHDVGQLNLTSSWLGAAALRVQDERTWTSHRLTPRRRPPYSVRRSGAAQAERANDRFETLREQVTIVDVGARVYERDKEAAGTLLGSALALRLFLFFMPFVLLVVGLAGVLGGPTDGSATSESAGSAARSRSTSTTPSHRAERPPGSPWRSDWSASARPDGRSRGRWCCRAPCRGGWVAASGCRSARSAWSSD